jgi:hypothetical protein
MDKIMVLYITILRVFREEHGLTVFENRTLMRIVGPKRNEVSGSLRKLHNEELHDLYSSPSITTMINSRRMRWEGNVTHTGEKRDAYMILMGKPEDH